MFQSAVYMAARVYMLWGIWRQALDASQRVLKHDHKHVGAMLIKAESLYNLCQFEHAMVLFHRGEVLAPEKEEFRLGVQKCRTTITDGMRGTDIFNVEGANMLFTFLRRSAEIKASDTTKYRYVKPGENTKSSISAILKMMENLKQKEADVKENKPAEVVKEVLDVPALEEELKSVCSAAEGNQVNADDKVDEKEENAENQTKSSVDLLKKTLLVGRSRTVLTAPLKKKSNSQRKDRLHEDKVYLRSLAKAIIPKNYQLDRNSAVVQNEVKGTAKETLKYLRDRDQFWDQVQIGMDGSQQGCTTFAGKAVESHRFLMI